MRKAQRTTRKKKKRVTTKRVTTKRAIKRIGSCREKRWFVEKESG
jgi:hypothetical protein